jgi:ketosteroid isomerase-like protein
MSGSAEAELLAVAAAWDRAMVGNDADEIGRYIADEWVIVGTDGSQTDRASFLSVIRDGRLTHHTMTTVDAEVRVYGAVGVLRARGVSAGSFDGHAFTEVERQSNVFVNRDGEWRCVLTHLSRIVEPGTP